MSDQGTTEAYRFGPFRFERATGRLYRDGDEVSLQPRASVLLEHLLENAGEVCSKQELMDLVWADVHVRRELWREIRPPDPTEIMNVQGFEVTADGSSYGYRWHRALSDLYLVDGLA